MASKRKSTTPCMVLPSETVEQDAKMVAITEGEEQAEDEVAAPAEDTKASEENEPGEDDMQAVDRYIKTMDSSMVEGGYECKYCSFQTPDLNMFTFHVDTEHPNVVLNSSYVCVECNFLTKRYDALSEHNTRYHPGEDNFTRTMVKRNNQTIFEQTVNDLTFDGSFVQQEAGEEGEDISVSGIPLSKTPIMKMKNKAEPKRIAVSHKVAEEDEVKVESEGEQEPKEVTSVPAITPVPVEQVKPSIVVNCSNLLQAEPKKTIINSATVLPASLAQVLSALQAQQNSQTQLLIPVSSIPTYNGAMDSNTLLVSTYNKFPYPSVSEIMGLAAQTKFTEEQIKIWFSAQRLKHGVSWTPEEVEDARRKQFNGTVHTVPQTITVIPAHLSTTANGLQSILQTCQIVGQPGLVLTQVCGANTLPVTTPITLTVAGMANQAQLPKPATIQTTPPAVETKRATTLQPPALTPQENSALGLDSLGLRTKKSKEQLGELKASYLKNHFASDAEISRLMKLTGLTKGEIKKWFSDTRYNQRNSKNNHVFVFNESPPSAGGSAPIIIDSSDETTESPPSVPVKETRAKTRNPFPDFTLQKFKEKTPEQLLVLEESFQKCKTPTDEELSRLRTETKLTRREVDAWFTERRKAPEVIEPKVEQKDSEAVKSHSSPRQRSQTPPSGKRQSRDKMGKKTPEQLHILKAAFVRTQWPSAEEYDKLADESGLPRSYIVNWFGDTRYAWKNGNLKWYYFYQSGNVGAINGSGYRKRGKGRARNRGRGWSRRNKRSSNWARSPPPMKFKSGKESLKEYYLKHKFLNEQDLDELVAKSNMGYEQVRDWFAEVGKRQEMGVDPFLEDVEEEAAQAEGESDAVAEQQMDGAADEDEEEDETDDSDAWEPPQSVRRTLSGSED
ncbi:zinc fingers and homeoboxes protein 1-like [Conger conger]|uniref:zinc fingers and homeoboxes protein 1-like n=1 Tax=Conger conger TaxID=82655 RepID=UPI002A59D5E0|nr:zinc fingers and homeoboxes protein 1-like [Conger conger]